MINLKEIMKNIRLFWIIIIFASIQTLSAQEKDPLYIIGAYAAYSHNLHFAEFRALPNVPCCGSNFSDGSGSGLAAGLLFELPINKTFLFGFRAGLISHGGLLEKTDLIGNSLNSNLFQTTGNTNPATDVYAKNTIDASLMSIGLDPYARFTFFDRVNSTIGFRIGYMFNGKFDQKEQITKPDNVTFLGGSVTRNERNNEEIPAFNPLQVWGLFGLSYDFPIGKKILLSPEINYYLPFIDLTDVYWKTASLQFGLSLRIPIFPDERIIIKDTVYNRDTTDVLMTNINNERIILLDIKRDYKEIKQGNTIIQRTSIAESYRREIPDKKILSCSVLTEAIASDGTKQKNPRVIVEETETEELFPILPQVFFPEKSTALSETGVRVLTRLEAQDFTEAKLPWKTLDLYRDVLNIIGLRLKQHASDKITFTGTNNGTANESGNFALSEKRALAVKDYLVETWGISESRIAIQKRGIPEMPSNSQSPDGIAENSRAEISSKDNAILQPVSLKDVRRTANPPVVEILPEANAEAGLASWQIDLSQDGNKIRQYSGDGSSLKTVKWLVEEEPIPSTESPVNINLSVNDKIGQNARASQDLKFEQLTIRKKREEIKDDKRIERFSLILFDFDKADIKPQHISVLNQIKQRIKPNSKVTISGYADRLGEKNYNRELANRRIENTQKILQVPVQNLTMKPVGSDFLLYDNSTPQGRAYSRTVQIVIETPIK